MSPLWLRTLAREPCYTQLSQLPTLLWLGQLLGLLLCTHDHHSIGDDCPGVLQDVSNLGLSDIFLMITLGLWVSFKFF